MREERGGERQREKGKERGTWGERIGKTEKRGRLHVGERRRE